MAAPLAKISHSFHRFQAPRFVKDISHVQTLAAKTDETIASFRQRGLFNRYCGPFTVHNYLHLSDSPVPVDSILRHFNLSDVNQRGSHAVKLRDAICACSHRVPIESNRLSNEQIDEILSEGSPIAVLLKGPLENHWLTLVGSDEFRYLALDYRQILPFDKREFPNYCLKFLYYPSHIKRKRGIEPSTEIPFLTSQPAKLHHRSRV